MFDLTRRRLLIALILAANLAAVPAFAKDGDSDGGSDDGDSDSGGSGNSGSGSNNSGSGSDDQDDDGDDDDENSGSVKVNNGVNAAQQDQNRALQAVRNGKAVSLQKLKSFLTQNHPGEILHVSLRRKSGTYYYHIRVLATGNRIKTLSLNAVTLQPGSV